jgi:hypothetical protein
MAAARAAFGERPGERFAGQNGALHGLGSGPTQNAFRPPPNNAYQQGSVTALASNAQKADIASLSKSSASGRPAPVTQCGLNDGERRN